MAFFLRQVSWLVFFAIMGFPPGIAALICVMIPVKFYLLSLSATAAPFGCLVDKVGLLLFFAGTALETVSEVQRKAFKDDARNAGRLYTGCLISLLRHANYFFDAVTYVRYVLLASNSWLGAAAWLAFETNHFVNGSIPELSHHLATKYKERWTAYCAATPYQLIPWVI